MPTEHAPNPALPPRPACTAPLRAWWPAARRAGRATLVATALAAAGGSAWAQSSPWYLIGAVSVADDDNLLRLSEGDEPAPGLSKSDTSTSTALIGGFDRPFGRQRLGADLTLRDTRYSSNDRFDNQSWSGSLRLDWEAAGRLSGRLSAASQRNASDFNTDQLGLLTERNDEEVESLSAVIAWGRGTQWRVEASGSSQRRRNSLTTPLVLARNLDQDTWGLGLVWRGSDRLELRLGTQEARVHFPTFRVVDSGFETDTYDQKLVETSVRWRLGGSAFFDLRVAADEIRYGVGDLRDSDGVDGSIGLDWRLSPKLRWVLRWAQDREVDSYPTQINTFFGVLPLIVADQRERQSLTSVLEWQTTAKTFFGLTLQQAERDLTRRTLFAFDGTLFSEVPEPARTTLVRLEWRWTPRRWVQLGCDLRVEDRRAPGPFTGNLDATRFGCSTQLTLQ